MKVSDGDLLIAYQVEMILAQQIASQSKYVVIPEVVRIVFDETSRVGVNVFPPAKDDQEHHDRKYGLTKRLYDLYEQHVGRYAAVRCIVNDLLDEARQQGLTIAIVK